MDLKYHNNHTLQNKQLKAKLASRIPRKRFDFGARFFVYVEFVLKEQTKQPSKRLVRLTQLWMGNMCLKKDCL